MKIALISFREGKLVESQYSQSMEMYDMKKTLAYAFLYNLPVNVYTDNRCYKGLKIISIKKNIKGNLFFSGTYIDKGIELKKNFSWREVKYTEIEIDREPANSGF
ncbi:MAG: hypothetical protein QXZ44_03655 [Ferroplasma sp.]